MKSKCNNIHSVVFRVFSWQILNSEPRTGLFLNIGTRGAQMFKAYLIFGLLICSIGQAATLDASKGKTEFLAIGRPSALKISGTGTGPAGDFTFTKDSKDKTQILLNGEAKMDLSSLDTGIGMRDKHMKEKYLQVEKYKEATLVFKDAKLAAGLLKSGGDVSLLATLKLHGTDKPVTVIMTIKPQDGKISASTKFALKLSEYAIDIPKFSGITVADEVQITTDTEVAKSALSDVL